MAKEQSDNSLYPIAVLIDELRNDDVNVSKSVCSVWVRLESLPVSVGGGSQCAGGINSKDFI